MCSTGTAAQAISRVWPSQALLLGFFVQGLEVSVLITKTIVHFVD